MYFGVESEMPVLRYDEMPRVKLGASIKEAVEAMVSQGSRILCVIGENERPVGWLDSLDVLRTLMQHPLAKEAKKQNIRELVRSIIPQEYLDVSGDLSVIRMWTEARGRFFIASDGTVGTLAVSGLLREALKERDKERELMQEGEARVEWLSQSQQVLEKALVNFFVDPKVMVRLKSIVEYKDEYDPATGKIRITEVIEDGVYRHVICILQLLEELWEQGLMGLAGIYQGMLVKTAVFHDLGKAQPYLEVGEVVDPREVFEPGKYHALRSASLARRVYCLEEDIIWLIKYHHHEEWELPADFPHKLLPMYRLFRLLDGLSAGITRRDSKVTLKVKGTVVEVKEESIHPSYNRCLEMDLRSGISEVRPMNRREKGAR